MDKDIFNHFNQPWLPMTAMGIFVTCFIIYVYWTYKKSNKKFYENSSYMPLHDGVKHER